MRYELPRSEDRTIWDIWLSMHHLPAMAIAAELGVYEFLETGPATPAETAQRLGFNRRATDVLFSMLSALGLTVLRDGRYELTDVTRTYLLQKSPYYWGPLLRTLGVLPQQRAALIRALHGADDAGSRPDHLPSKAWEGGHMDRAQAESVSRIMHCHSLPASVAVARSGSLDGVSRVLDVGGGSGCFSIAIAQHLPNIRCSVMELPAVCEVARSYIEEGGVSARVDTRAVDMFHEAWPHGYDGIFFSNVFHDWSAETNLFLARRAYDALPRDGRIVLHEMLLAEDGSGPITTASFSMLLLFGTQGRQYSFGEIRQILESAGFVDVSVRTSYGYYSIVKGRKP
jgi:protein-L-isoaspartate O-methyltransferase